MAITDEQYQAWLESPSEERNLLVEASYFDGSNHTEYMSTRGYITASTDSPVSTPYDDIIKAFPLFRRSMQEAFTGRTQQSFGDIEITNEDGVRDSWLERSWNGRDITLLFGDPSWEKADYRTILAGSVAELTAKSIDTLVIKLRDKGVFLEKQMQTSVFSTGTNINRVLPVCYGQCKHIAPILEDDTTHKYKVHDGAISAISAVYDKGVSISFTANLPDGSFTLSSQPAGQITADVNGAKFAGISEGAAFYFDNIADIAYDIIKNRSDLLLSDINTTSFSDFKTAHTQSIGIYIDGKDKHADVLDRIISSIGGWWGFDRDGQITLGQLIDPEAEPSVLTLVSDDIIQGGMAIKRRQLPSYKVSIGHTLYQKTQGANDVAGSITEAQIADFEQPYRLAIAVDTTVRNAHLLSGETAIINTQLADDAEATTEAARRLVLGDTLRTVYNIDAFSTPFSINLGDIITIEHDRFGFDAGENAIVVGYSESVTPPRIKLEVWKKGVKLLPSLFGFFGTTDTKGFGTAADFSQGGVWDEN